MQTVYTLQQLQIYTREDKTGVPKGGVLSPTLFNIHCRSPDTNILKHHNSSIRRWHNHSISTHKPNLYILYWMSVDFVWKQSYISCRYGCTCCAMCGFVCVDIINGCVICVCYCCDVWGCWCREICSVCWKVLARVPLPLGLLFCVHECRFVVVVKWILFASLDVICYVGYWWGTPTSNRPPRLEL